MCASDINQREPTMLFFFIAQIIIFIGAIAAFTSLLVLLLHQWQSKKLLRALHTSHTEHSKNLDTWFTKMEERTHQHQELAAQVFRLLNEQQHAQQQQRAQFDQQHLQTLKMLQESLQNGLTDVR